MFQCLNDYFLSFILTHKMTIFQHINISNQLTKLTLRKLPAETERLGENQCTVRASMELE